LTSSSIHQTHVPELVDACWDFASSSKAAPRSRAVASLHGNFQYAQNAWTATVFGHETLGWNVLDLASLVEQRLSEKADGPKYLVLEPQYLAFHWTDLVQTLAPCD